VEKSTRVTNPRKLRRVRRGLWLTMAAPCVLLGGLILGSILTGEFEMPALLALCLSTLVLLFGQVFCLSAPRGHVALAICLFLDVAIGVTAKHNLEAAGLLAVLSWISLLRFLAQLGDSLEYPRLRHELRVAIAHLVAGVGYTLLGFFLQNYLRPFVSNGVTTGHIIFLLVLGCCLMGGPGYVLAGLGKSFFLLKVGAEACTARLVQEEMSDPKPSAIA
jgi:hypothetical protein